MPITYTDKSGIHFGYPDRIPPVHTPNWYDHIRKWLGLNPRYYRPIFGYPIITDGFYEETIIGWELK